jgi:predicted RNase H-like nuclease
MILAGVDGCRAGWIAVIRRAGTPDEVRTFPAFRDLVEVLSPGSFVAVDMPIGLPERISRGGRGPESAIRPLLGKRQSSVFSIPARAAVFSDDYRQACAAALASSDPPRKVSRQAFHLFAKIREVDAVFDAPLPVRVLESHPELVFWRLNGESPASLPKKVKGAVNAPGMEERRRLLEANGFDPAFLRARPPRGAAADDFLDACACLLTAQRAAAGEARPFPEPPLADARGREVAIWV